MTNFALVMIICAIISIALNILIWRSRNDQKRVLIEFVEFVKEDSKRQINEIHEFQEEVSELEKRMNDEPGSQLRD